MKPLVGVPALLDGPQPVQTRYKVTFEDRFTRSAYGRRASPIMPSHAITIGKPLIGRAQSQLVKNTGPGG